MAPQAKVTEWLSPTDPNSFARPNECRVVDLNLDLHVDFSNKVVSGTAEYKCKRDVGASVLVSVKSTKLVNSASSLIKLLKHSLMILFKILKFSKKSIILT